MDGIVNDLQQQTLRLYGALVELREDWAHALVLCCGNECALTGIPSAVSIATGTTLAVDSNAAAMKQAMRRGEVDFVVTSLDEALRTLKNEIRQGRALSVGVIADTRAVLAEAVERGVLPALWVEFQNPEAKAWAPEIASMQAQGMPSLNFDEAAAESNPWLAKHGWKERFLAAASAVELRAVDASLLALVPESDTVRRRWIQRAPQYLRGARLGGRWIWLSEDESQKLQPQS